MQLRDRELTAKKIPKLRFPGFSGEWEEKKLSDMLNMVIDNRGKTPPIESVGIPLLEVNSLGRKHVNYSKVTKYVSKKTYESWFRKHLQPNDILFSTVGATALCSFYDGEINATVAQNIVGLRFRNEDSNFMFYLLTERKNNHQFKRIEMGAVQPSVKVSQMVKINFLLPKKSEQQKIAEFLTTVDGWIQNLRSQKESLESYKKGMMQKIFSQKIRFKDENGNNFPDWEEKRLEDLATIKTGKKDVNAGDSKGKYPFFTCAREHTFSNEYSFSGEAIMIAGNAEVGLCSYYDGQFEAYQRTYVLQNFKILGKYLFKYLSQYFRQYALGLKQTGAMSFIKLGMLKDFIVPIPSLVEQRKIAEFLTSLDNLIDSKQKQVDQAEEWKKGLMQGLFV